ncbi:uncharacterized protein TNCV_299501 [Trichonephila clavipes]|nr:uncharacterized protein TNCV_299501 [Trichonephila clavipes]
MRAKLRLFGKVHGPFVFGEPTVTGSAYLDALQLWLVSKLKEGEPDNFIWQQDGAPPHRHLSACDWLNITVPDQWIGRKGPQDKVCFAWPPRSPDLTRWDILSVVVHQRFDEVHFWLNDYVNKQNCRIWSEANPQVYVETPLHPEKLTVWCALWAGGILLQKR